MIFKEFNPNEDDCHKVAKLVYSVDQKTYLKIFKSEDSAISVIEKLLLAGKKNFTPKKTIFNNEFESNENNNSFNTNPPHKTNDKHEFYIILNENNKTNSDNVVDNGHINHNGYDADDEIIGLVQIVKGELNGLFGDILNVFKHLKISDAFKFSFIYILDYFILTKTIFNDFYIAELAIDEKKRGKGLGTAVLKEIIKKAKDKNFKRVVLDVNFNNEGAFKLYRSLGFKVFNKRKVKLFNKERGMNNMEYIL